MAHCVAPRCKNYFAVKEKIFQETGKRVSFHQFPKEKGRRNKWLTAVRIRHHEGKKVTKNSHVCSFHFKEDEIKKTLTGMFVLKPGVIPSIFWKPTKRRKVLTKISDDQENTLPEHSVSDDIPSSSASIATHFHDYFVPKQSKEEMLEASRKEIERLQKCIDEANKKIVHMEKIGLERYSKDPDMIRFYTGFSSYATLISFFNAISPHAANMIKWNQLMEGQKCGLKKNKSSISNKLSLMDQFLCFLQKVRLGSMDTDLADKFGVSQSTISRNTISWANFLYCLLGSQPLWPTKEQVQQHMPSLFKEMYPNVRVILDCTELAVQSTPSSVVLNTELFSCYKGKTIFKALLGITPSGCVSFISSLYSGSISDKKITRMSGVLDLLEEGDEVMADKSFTIDDLLNEKGCQLVIPHFLQKRGQFSVNENQDNKQNSNLSVHVERAIRKVRGYHIFKSVLPLSLAGTINQLWIVCCYLTNFQSPLI